LYALVEELRAVAPRPRSAAWLARRFEVTARTIERDLEGLRQAGVPIWAETGRRGGYTLDRDRTLPPLALTADEALAMSVALRAVATSPFADDARRAGLKLRAVLPPDVRRREQMLARRLHVVEGATTHAVHDRVVREALKHGQLVHLRYHTPSGQHTDRDVEPLGLLWGDPGWYLLGWCRLRDGIRGFKLDRIVAAELRDEIIVDPRPEDLLRRDLERFDAAPFDTDVS
jgi:predicted DNA-binding transcriptional regulator YafY